MGNEGDNLPAKSRFPPEEMERARGFPGGPSGKEPACQFRRPRGHGFEPLVGKILWWKAWQPTPEFLGLENPCGQRSLAGYSPQGGKESDTAEAT